MISFKSLDLNGNELTFQYESKEELEKEWRSDIEIYVPANDDPIYDVVIDGKEDLREATFERIGTDEVWFEDLLTYLGIDIWR